MGGENHIIMEVVEQYHDIFIEENEPLWVCDVGGENHSVCGGWVGW